VGLELENVAAAVAEAKKRLIAARAAAERQARIDAASEATAIAAQMATQAGLVGEGIIATIARIQAYSELAQRAARLDCGSVNPRLIVVHLRRVLDNELSIIFGEGRLPPSAEVKTAAELLSGYAARLRLSAARIIGEQDEEAA
jgi:hypothetical protein